MKDKLIKDFSLTNQEIALFDKYAEFLQTQNQVMNLTSITDIDDIYIKHFYDSLLLYKVNPDMQELADVGSGAGFPGLVYAIKTKQNNPSISLIEPIKKRCNFLNQAKDLLQLDNVQVINQRIEDMHNSYMYMTSRAVAKINILLELIIPRLSVNGIFYCMKGANYLEELNDAQNALKILNTRIEHIYKFNLPNNLGERYIIAFKKIMDTPSIYPRRYAAMIKKPL